MHLSCDNRQSGELPGAELLDAQRYLREHRRHRLPTHTLDVCQAQCHMTPTTTSAHRKNTTCNGCLAIVATLLLHAVLLLDGSLAATWEINEPQTQSLSRQAPRRCLRHIPCNYATAVANRVVCRASCSISNATYTSMAPPTSHTPSMCAKHNATCCSVGGGLWVDPYNSQRCPPLHTKADDATNPNPQPPCRCQQCESLG